MMITKFHMSRDRKRAQKERGKVVMYLFIILQW